MSSDIPHAFSNSTAFINICKAAKLQATFTWRTQFLNIVSSANTVSQNIIHIPLFDKESFFKFSTTHVHPLHIYTYSFYLLSFILFSVTQVE